MHIYTTGKIPAAMQPAVNLMTNWERNQWARAGYPLDLKIVSARRERDGLDLSYVTSDKARLPRSRNIPVTTVGTAP